MAILAYYICPQPNAEIGQEGYYIIPSDIEKLMATLQRMSIPERSTYIETQMSLLQKWRAVSRDKYYETYKRAGA